MKNILIGLLKRGHTSTKKYTADDLVRAFYPLNGMIAVCPVTGYIRIVEGHPFIQPDNLKKRMELLYDLRMARFKDFSNPYTYRIFNRIENGDGYGIGYKESNV